jgi:hypothetical protein
MRIAKRGSRKIVFYNFSFSIAIIFACNPMQLILFISEDAFLGSGKLDIFRSSTWTNIRNLSSA